MNYRIPDSIALILLLIATNCTTNDSGNSGISKNTSYNSFTSHIAISEGFKNPESPIQLSDIAKEISYVVLETNQDCLIQQVMSVKVVNEKGFLVNNNLQSLLFFDKEGNFIWKINNQGRGPYEYETLNPALEFDSLNNEILIPDLDHILVYDLLGKLVREIKLSFYINQIYAISSGLYFVSNSNPTSEYLGYIINRDGAIVKRFIQYNNEQKIDDRGRLSYFTNASIEHYNNSVMINNGDTVWKLNQDLNLEIMYTLNAHIRRQNDRTYRYSFHHLQDTLIGFFFMYQKFNFTYNTITKKYNKINGYGPNSKIIDDIDFGCNVALWNEKNGILIDAVKPSNLLAIDTTKLRNDSELKDIIHGIDENANPVLRLIKLE